MVNTFFWLLIYVTLLALLVHFYLLEILQIVIVLMFFDLVLLVVLIYHKEEGEGEILHGYINMKLETIEKSCEQILKGVFSPETKERLEREEKDIIKWLEKF